MHEKSNHFRCRLPNLQQVKEQLQEELYLQERLSQEEELDRLEKVGQVYLHLELEDLGD